MKATDRHRPAERGWQIPRLRGEGRVVGGVAAGIADEIGVDPAVVRAAFVLLSAAGGWGLVLYVGAWGVMAWNERRSPDVVAPVPKGATETRRLAGVGLVVAGLLVAARTIDVGFVDAVVWPLALLTAGAAVAWHRGMLGSGSDVADWRGLLRVGAGALLAVTGIVLLLTANLDLADAWVALVFLGIVVAGLAVVAAPWAWRLLGDLAEERRRRIRSEERSEVAAHLHDSVLQTLSLIQRHGDDPKTMVSLARRQERELRAWLHGNGTDPGTGRFRRGLERVAAEVEEHHRVPIEVVVVGDAPSDPTIDGLLAAAREAMVNASVHSGASRIDVYGEVGDDLVEVFVRDTGRGFDPRAVPADRRGLAESVRGRMRRAGGDVEIATEPGRGTEVGLRLPRTREPAP